MNDEKHTNDFDFLKFLLDILSNSEDSDKEETEKEEKPKEEKEKKEEKEEIERNEKDPVLSFMQQTEKREEQKPDKPPRRAVTVDSKKLYDLHQAITQAVNCMNAVSDSIKFEDRSRWIKIGDVFRCFNCFGSSPEEYDYCPHCGCRMEKKSGSRMFFGA